MIDEKITWEDHLQSVEKACKKSRATVLCKAS